MHWKIIEINAKLLFHVTDKKQSTVFIIKIEYKITFNKSSSRTYQATFISNYNCRNERPGKHRWHVLCSTSLVSKQSQALQRKSAQTPGKADLPTRERVSTWWVNRRIQCMPCSQQTAKEEVFEIVLFGWKCCHFDNNIFQPLDTFHFSLFLLPQRFSFLAKVSVIAWKHSAMSKSISVQHLQTAFLTITQFSLDLGLLFMSPAAAKATFWVNIYF